MRTSLLFAPALCVLAMACSDQKKTVDAEPEAKAEKPATKSFQLGGTDKADTLFFSLERTPCFGTCKAYRINVYRSGYATFDGRSNVEKEGAHDGRVSPEIMDDLLQEAVRIKFFDLQDKYDGPVTDLPSSIIHVVANGKDKKVIGRVGTPENFKSFVTKAEEWLYPLPWKPVAKSE
ncbi:MAG: hypothetical protein JNM62_14870 [Flavobacteriales bacterium]|nr:hypothetical protein [Flavobacteriales bacterium]